MNKKLALLSIISLIAVASSALDLDEFTLSYESSWTMSENNTVTFTMHGFDASLINIEGGTLSQITVNIFLNRLVGSFATSPDLGLETKVRMSLATMNTSDVIGFANETAPFNGRSGDGILYTFKKDTANPTAMMAFFPSNETYSEFVTDTTLLFTLTGTIPPADVIHADYNLAGSGTSVISYTYYGMPAPVPEPSSAALALVGLVMLFTKRRLKA